MAVGFFDGDKANASPESIKRKRELAARMMAGLGRAPRDVGEGLNALGGGIASAMMKYQAGQQEKEGRATADALIARIMGGGAPMAAVGGAPVATGGAAGSSATKAPQSFSGTQAEFVAKIMPYAEQEGQRTGVDPRIIVAQAALESGFGRSAPGNNFFGIKSHGKPGGQTFATTEVINGQTKRINDSFRTFASMGDSVRGYGDFLQQNPRYRPMLEARGLDAQIAALGRSGYATDPNYASKIRSIASGIRMPVVSPGPGAAPMPLARQQAQTAPMPTVGLADMPAPGANQSALEARPVAPVSGDNPQQLLADAAYYEQNGNPEAARQMRERAQMAGQGAPAMAQGAPPMAPGGGVAIANNEDDVRFLEARMAAEQGNPQAPMPAPDMPNAQNADNVFSNVPMGLGANQFVERAPFEPAQQGMPNAQNAGDVFSPIPMGLGANPFVQRPPFEQSADQPAPTAQEVAINPARDTVPLPASNVQPEAQPQQQPRQAPPQLMPMNMGGENGASPMQFIESEFARREGRPDPRMAMGAPMAQAPQMPAGGPPMASDAAPMAQSQPQGGGMNMAALGQFLNSPFVSAENKRMVLAQFEQQRATQQAEAERMRADQQSEQAFRAAGIDPALRGNPVIAQQAAAAKFREAPESFRDLTPAERTERGIDPNDKRPYQISTKTGKLSGVGGAQTNVSVNTGGGSDKQFFDSVNESATSARAAVTGLQALQNARKAVTDGGFFGAGADVRLGFAKLGTALGFEDGRVTNTETFRSAIAPQIAAMMKATVGSTQISNADREFAEKAAGGSIALDQPSITRLLDIMERGSRTIVEGHQKRLDAVYPPNDPRFARERSIFGVESPAPTQTGPARPSSKAEFDALPSGSTFIAPDGTTRRKP